MKVVFDTNIYISAFVVPGGKAEEAYLGALRRSFTLCTSVAILTETGKKLREKFGWQEDTIIELLKAISRTAHVMKTRPHLRVLSDDPDNRILECALVANADFIVAGDKHLITLKEDDKIPIVGLSDFLKKIQEPSL